MDDRIPTLINPAVNSQVNTLFSIQQSRDIDVHDLTGRNAKKPVEKIKKKTAIPLELSSSSATHCLFTELRWIYNFSLSIVMQTSLIKHYHDKVNDAFI